MMAYSVIDLMNEPGALERVQDNWAMAV